MSVYSDQPLQETPVPGLLRDVTGIEPKSQGCVVFGESSRISSTQRLELYDVGGGLALFTWPAELKPQAQYLYEPGRAPRLLAMASEDDWDVEARPHLAYRNAPWQQRLYLSPTIAVSEYVSRWVGADGRRIGQHDPDTIRTGLWPWLIERGYASEKDAPGLEPFLLRLGEKRPAHLRPGLRLLRRWSREEVIALRSQDRLEEEIRGKVNRLLGSVGDGPLRLRSQ